MKKFLPMLLAGAGVIVLIAGFFLVKSRGSKEEETVIQPEETALQEIALADRPVATLTPTSDGHFLNLSITKIKIPNAATLDYEFIYQLPDGRTQGAPGTVKLSGVDSVTRKLLLGSESSGKFRYDEGVKEGALALRFRNSGGKLVAKFSSDFALLSNIKDLASVDGNFQVTLSKLPQKTFFVLMQTFGVPGGLPDGVDAGPYGLFTSATAALSGSVKLGSDRVFYWDGGSWVDQSAVSSLTSGIFIGTSK
jgi:hypothetical protein